MQPIVFHQLQKLFNQFLITFIFHIFHDSINWFKGNILVCNLSDLISQIIFKILFCCVQIIKSQQNQVMHYSFKSTPTITLKSRTQTITKSNQLSSIPGPAQYNVKKPLPQTGTIAQTKQKRQLWTINNISPGPGKYQPKSYITDGVKRTMSARIIHEPFKTPGPLDYQQNTLKVKSKSPVYTMGNKSKSARKIIQDHNLYKPAPTIYQSKSSFSKSAGLIFGSSNRKDLTQTQKTPGSNFYQTEKVTFNHSMNPRCSIGAQKRQLKIAVFQETPGPGKYQNKTVFQLNESHKKGFTCKDRIRNLVAQQISRYPAPGQYKSQIMTFKSTAPRCATTQTQRKTFIDQAKKAKNHVPQFVTNQDNLLTLSSTKYRASSVSVFSKSNRKPLDQNQKTPGPLAYDNNQVRTLNKQPSYSCAKIFNKNQFLKVMDPENPGPGTYDSKYETVKKNNGNIITMREQRPNFEKQRKKPGPGQYNLITEKKPKFGSTNQKRISFTDLKNQAKYGTHYDINTNMTNPPSYMKVESKIKFSPSKSALRSTGF